MVPGFSSNSDGSDVVESRKRQAVNLLKGVFLASATVLSLEAVDSSGLGMQDVAVTVRNLSAVVVGTVSLVCTTEVLSRLSRACKLARTGINLWDCIKGRLTRVRALPQSNVRRLPASRNLLLRLRKDKTRFRARLASHGVLSISRKVRGRAQSGRSVSTLWRAAAAMRRDATRLRAESQALGRQNQALQAQCGEAFICLERCTAEIMRLRQTVDVAEGSDRTESPPPSPVANSQGMGMSLCEPPHGFTYAPGTPEMQRNSGNGLASAASLAFAPGTPDGFAFAPGTPEGHADNDWPRRTPTFGSGGPDGCDSEASDESGDTDGETIDQMVLTLPDDIGGCREG